MSTVPGLSDRQAGYAATIINRGQALGFSKADQGVAIMVALDETGLRNLANPNVPDSLRYPNDGEGTDHDSIGLFQQRPSAGWGTVAELMDPATSADKFYHALGMVSLRGHLPPWVTAQQVQKSGTPDGSNYHKYYDQAQGIMDALGQDSSVVPGLPNLPNPLKGLDAVNHALAWLMNGKNWARIGLFVLGAGLIGLAVWSIVKDTGPVKAAVKVAEAAV